LGSKTFFHAHLRKKIKIKTLYIIIPSKISLAVVKNTKEKIQLRHACVNRSETRKKTQLQEQLTTALNLGCFEKRVHCETAVCNIVPAGGVWLLKTLTRNSWLSQVEYKLAG